MAPEAALLIALTGAGIVILGRTDRGQGRVIAALMQAWGGGLVLLSLLTVVVVQDSVVAGAAIAFWFLGGLVAVVVADLHQGLRARRHAHGPGSRLQSLLGRSHERN